MSSLRELLDPPNLSTSLFPLLEKHLRTDSYPCRPAVDLCTRKLTLKWSKPVTIPQEGKPHSAHTLGLGAGADTDGVLALVTQGRGLRHSSVMHGHWAHLCQPCTPAAGAVGLQDTPCHRLPDPTCMAKCSGISAPTLFWLGIQKHALRFSFFVPVFSSAKWE